MKHINEISRRNVAEFCCTPRTRTTKMHFER